MIEWTLFCEYAHTKMKENYYLSPPVSTNIKNEVENKNGFI